MSSRPYREEDKSMTVLILNSLRTLEAGLPFLLLFMLSEMHFESAAFPRELVQ
jgi:hypothetical protein